MKSFTKILLVAALALLPMYAAAPAQAAKKMEVAIQNEGVFLYNQYYNRDLAFRQLRALGATHLRMNLFWWQAVPESQRNLTQRPARIQYDFRLWDAAIQRARDFGITVQLALAGDPPAWACGNRRLPNDCDGRKPKLGLYKHFAKAVARHYKGTVKRFSIWNEPNWYTWLSPHKKSPLLYRKMVQKGYKGIKKGNRKAEVVIGELAPHFQKRISMAPLDFIRRMVCVNKRLKPIRGAKRKCKGKLKFDAFSTHPYDFEHKPTKKRSNRDELTIANLGALPKLLNKLRKKGLIKPKRKRFPIYLTEHGYMVSDNPAVKPRRRIPESKRARWIVKSWKIAQRTPRIKQNLHFGFVSPPLSSPSGFFDMGLLTPDGVPRQSYHSLRSWIQQALAEGKVKRAGPCSAC